MEGGNHPSWSSRFASAKALSFRNDSPETASRPFDAEDGFVIGEDLEFLFLKLLQMQKKEMQRSMQKLSVMEQPGMLTTLLLPHLEALEAEAIKLALEDSAINLEQVDYINAHAITSANDKNETSAIKSIF